MSRNLGLKTGWLALAAIAIAVFVVPATEANPINYNFTVNVTSGPLSGTVSHGSFSYDSSSIVLGTSWGEALFTNLDFPFNDITYNADTISTRWLYFDAASDLTAFMFGTNCSPAECVAGTDPDADQFIASATKSDPTDPYAFGYTLPTFDGFVGGSGEMTFARVGAPVSAVPEPGTFGMLGLGVLLTGLFAGMRRRTVLSL